MISRSPASPYRLFAREDRLKEIKQLENMAVFQRILGRYLPGDVTGRGHVGDVLTKNMKPILRGI
jgi:hypothetical protein